MRFKLYLFIFFFLFSCNSDYTPKPRGFFKLNLPLKEYKLIQLNCPFYFETPVYSKLTTYKNKCLFDIEYINLDSKLHVTYLPINDNLFENTEQSRDLAYKHNIVADAISEQLYINDSLNVYGIVYDYSGSTATALQFFLTDSVNHFFRGALYFNTEISDSIKPLNNFIKQDVKHMIETFRWKDI